MDFTISGQVNRALFITDTDGGTSAEVKNNADWSTRIRANGSSELEGGGDVRIQFEYEESGTGVKLRHANVQYGGDFGRVTLGQGSEAGDGSQYLATTGVNGIGHGAGTSSRLHPRRLVRLPRRRWPDPHDPLRHPGYRPGLGCGLGGQ